MKLNERLNYINKKLREASETGADLCRLNALEKQLSELIEINNWIKEEVKGVNRINRDDTGWYFELKNNLPVNFKYFKVAVKVFYKERLIDAFEARTENFYKGNTAKMYFDADVKEGSVLSIDADSVDYALMET